MICEKEASPSINSVSPGAFGSADIAEIVGDAAARSTTTTLALRAISRAMVSAVSVMLSLEAVPRMVILRASAPAPRRPSARRSISVTPVTLSGRVTLCPVVGNGARAVAVGAEHQGCQRRDQHDRQLLRIGRGVGNAGAGNDSAVRRRSVDVFAGVGLAIFREIGFQKVALRLGFALERPKLDVLTVGRGRLLLQLLKTCAQAFNPAAGDARIAIQRTRYLARFVPNLPIEIGKLRLQLLDTRVTVEQRR